MTDAPSTLIQPQVDALITLALAEDVGTGDQTTLATVAADARASAYVMAKEPLVVAGLPFFAQVFQHVDPTVEVLPLVPEGAEVAPGTDVARVVGRTHSLLVGERTALNILQRLCATATSSRRYAEAVAGTGARICDTRKTTPGMRVMQKYAVAVGGASNHRFGLDSGVLIKDNHIAAAGGITAAIERARARIPHGLKIEIETKSLAEVDEAVAAKADIIMLDNMDVAMMTAAVERIRASSHPILVEASGNLTLSRLREVAECGVDLLSVGALTHSAGASDLSMKIRSTGSGSGGR